MRAPIGKYRPSRRIDAQPDNPFGSGVEAGDNGGGITVPPVSPPTVPVPTDLTVDSALTYSAVTPSARLDITWHGYEAYDLEYYIIQVSTSSTFAANVESFATKPNADSASIDGRRVSTTYYVRIAAVVGTTQSDWSATVSETTPADTTPPAAPTSQAAAFINGGDLVVTWTNPTSNNFRDVEIKIYESASKVTLYDTFYDATQRFVWPVRANLQATSNVGDPSLYVELRSRSWGNVFSTSVNASATKAAPSAPTVTLTGGFSLLVCQVTSTPESVYSKFEYVWKRDGVTVRTLVSPATEQQYETGASGDEGSHSWTCTVRQLDAFGQGSGWTVSGAVALDTLTISYLRSGAFYSDSDSNTFTPPASGTLAALKDNNTASGGVNYAV